MNCNKFLPEGSLINTKENILLTSSVKMLEQARKDNSIIEGLVSICDSDHNLIIELNGLNGIIEHKESAIGIDDGSTREIAIISKVGKPVACIVSEIDTSSSPAIIRLSRKRAQEKALEHMINKYSPGDVIPAKITHLEPFGAFVDIGCGIISFIGIETISVSRISHPKDRFTVGSSIYSVITKIDKNSNRISLSHRELLGTWSENASLFSPGQTVRGVVRGIENYGIFIELTPNLSGLAEYCSNLHIGDTVSVYIKSIIPEKMKIKLVIIDTLREPHKNIIDCTNYFITEGKMDTWHYSPEVCIKKKIKTVFPSF